MRFRNWVAVAGIRHFVIRAGFKSVLNYLLETVFSFAETFRSFFAEAFWSLRNFGHLSHSCIKTRCNSFHLPIISEIPTEMT